MKRTSNLTMSGLPGYVDDVLVTKAETSLKFALQTTLVEETRGFLNILYTNCESSLPPRDVDHLECKLMVASKSQHLWTRYQSDLHGLDLLLSEDSIKSPPPQSHRITFLSKDNLMTLETEDILSRDSTTIVHLSDLSESFRALIFTSDGVQFFLKFEDKLSLDTWLAFGEKQLRSHMGDELFQRKQAALRKAKPVLKDYAIDQWLKFKTQLGERMDSSSEKVKEGYLFIKERETDLSTAYDSSITWKELYFILIRRELYYFLSSTSDRFEGYLDMEKSSITPTAPAIIAEGSAEEFSFDIETPMERYTMRARHKDSYLDWYRALSQVSASGSTHSITCSVPIKEPTELQYAVVTQPGGTRPQKFILSLCTTIGRDSRNSIVLDKDNLVSRCHVRLEQVTGGKLKLTDMGSTRGTFVAGKRVDTCELMHHDVIKIGNTSIVLFLAS